MRMAIISDSHGNLTALDAVLADLDADGPFDAVVVGGDNAYGGPFPRECIDRVMQRGLPAVRGNTDEMIISALEGGGDSLGKWVIDQLETYHVDYLKMFSFQYNVETGDGRRLAIVHATPWSIEESVLPESHDREFERMLREADADALAYGHIHLQHQRNLPNGVVIAVGSVGLPFDGDQRAMYTVIEASSRSWNVEFRRVAYDVERAIAEARNSGSPNGEGFAHNLATASRPT
jgi:putative phosphoesterase